MSIEITMPALSPTMEEGNLVKWNVKEGDKIEPGDVIAEIETDKATMEVEAADEGVVAKIVVPEGTQGVKVNSLIAILAEDGESVADAANASSNSADAPKAAPATQPASVAPVAQTASMPASSPAVSTASVSKQDGNRVFASPLARRLAKQGGVELSAITGSGPHGRIIKRDVDAALAGGVKATTSASTAPTFSAAPSDEQVLKLFKQGEYDITPHDSMRKTIAKRLVESKQQVPHFYVTIDCELDKLLKLRSELNAAAPIIKTEAGEKPAYKLSVNDMVIKATALALKAVPDANVSWLESGLVRHHCADIGVAVSIPNGLITPIIRKAEDKPLSVISNEMKDLAKRARERKLKPEEYQGGSSSVSNMGMFGVKNFSAIINPPQSTIFAIGAGEKRAVVKNDALAIATIMSVTLSTDHRCVDGALAAELAQTFKNFIENPMSMLV